MHMHAHECTYAHVHALMHPNSRHCPSTAHAHARARARAHAHAHACTCTCTCACMRPPVRARTHTQARAHARTHTHARVHTQIVTFSRRSGMLFLSFFCFDGSEPHIEWYTFRQMESPPRLVSFDKSRTTEKRKLLSWLTDPHQSSPAPRHLAPTGVVCSSVYGYFVLS